MFSASLKVGSTSQTVPGMAAYPTGVPPTSNSQIADALDELGDLYELDGAVIHRVVAYRTAAKAIRDSPVSVEGLTRDGRVKEIAGIGATLEQKIRDLIDTGEIPAAVKLRAASRPGCWRSPRSPTSAPSARAGCSTSSASTPPRRFARPPRRSVCASCADSERSSRNPSSPRSTRAPPTASIRARRVVLDRALAVSELLIDALRALAPDARIELAGSARRRADSVKDLDIVLDEPALLDQLAGARADRVRVAHERERGARADALRIDGRTARGRARAVRRSARST